VIAGGNGGIAFAGFVAVVFQIAVRVETGHAAQEKGGKCEAGPFHALRVPTALALDGCRGGSRNRKGSAPAECEFDRPWDQVEVALAAHLTPNGEHRDESDQEDGDVRQAKYWHRFGMISHLTLF